MTNHEQDRRAKLERICAAGIDPYPTVQELYAPYIGWVRNQHKAEFGRDGGPSFSVSGRVVLRRGMGKLGFLTIEDETGRIQLALDHSRLSEQSRLLAKNLDLGDIVVAGGKLGATQTGEITIWVEELHLVSKALLPPPDKLDGLKDQESRYRNRHLDLWNPEVKKVLETRSHIIREIRTFLSDRGFIEVETPMMQASPGGAIAKPFKTHHNALDIDLYLRIAPELYLKKLIIGGMGRVFEIGKNFRNEGLSPKHNPEFTALEIYQAFANYETMMDLMENLYWHIIQHITEGEVFCKPFKRVRMNEISKGKTPEEQHAHYEQYIEPTLIEPTFVTHFPISAVPLAKESKEFPGYAEMFELVINGQEIAPGYTEQNDPDAQLKAFQAQNADGHVLDEDFVEALKHGMPPTGGLGIGIDRLVAVLTGQSSIRDVILFPLLRPKEKD